MHKAVIAAGQIAIEPEQLIEFESRGRLLLIGSGEQINLIAPQLEPLELYCLPLDDSPVTDTTGMTIIRQQLNGLSGWLGAFHAEIGSQVLEVDLVLDLGEQPVIGTKVPPLGYFAPGDNQQNLAEALQQLPDMIGIFDKPKFFNYNANICAHSRRGINGCQQCIDACPALAIESTGYDLVSVNPSLCQGCGSCTVVCPSGAMSYALPKLDVSINRLRTMLQTYFSLEQAAPHILIHDETNGQQLLQPYQDSVSAQVIPFSIEEIGALGMPFWLSALAFGAARVTVWDAGSHPEHDWLELQRAIEQSNELLSGLGYGEQRIDWLASKRFEDLLQHIDAVSLEMNIERAQFAGLDDKRRVTTMALTHLHQHAPQPVTMMGLKEGAAFGQIEVDKETCTLCMSCVSVCPVGAVLDGVDKPQLNFIEDLCVQCGMCETACPEDSINLNSRYLFDREQARQKRILHEEPIFHCISCNKPFATQKMIDTMMAKLADHPMFQGEALQRLQMCEDCRVKAMFKDSQGR